MSVSSVLANVSQVIGTVVSTISSNGLLSAFLGLGLVGAGAATFRKLRGSSK